MKGLVLKDYYSVRFMLFGGIALMLLPNVMVAITGGNIGNDDPDVIGAMSEYIAVMIYGMMNYISITLFSSFILNTLESDEKSGWAKMQRVMPVTGGQIIGGKLVAMAVVLGILTVMSLICNISGVIFFNLPAEPLIAIPFIAALLQTITLSLCIIAGYRLGARYNTLIYIVTEVLIVACIVFLMIRTLNENVSITAIRLIIYAAIPVITAMVLIISFIYGKKAVMKDI